MQVSAADLLQRIQALRAGKAAAIEEEQLISTEMARIQREQKVKVGTRNHQLITASVELCTAIFVIMLCIEDIRY
jgi:hypothetical protein